MFRLAKLSLANRALIALITVFAAVFGVITMGSLKQELIPSLEFPQITVISAMPGASPEVVDKQVSEPLESALNAVEGLESSSSTSRTGISTVSLTFAYGTDLDRARGQVDRAISTAEQALPEDVAPNALAGSISDLPIVFMAVSSDQSLSELKSDLERLTIPRLQKIDGVRSAEVTGGTTRHIAVLPDQAKLTAAGLTTPDVLDALEKNGSLIPVGVLDTGEKALTIQIGSPIESLDDVRALPLPGENGPVPLGELASVSLENDDPASITRTNGEETLALSVTKTPDGDTVTISHEVTDLLNQLEEELGSGANITVVFDQAPFIEKSIEDLTTEGLLGLGFAVLVILVFLMSVRSTIVTAISIPLSLLITFIGLYTVGFSLNILTLGALTIAIGRVVDDSIVVIENIKRHLSYGEEKGAAILTAVREVSGAITASTLTTVAVFAPIAFVGDLAGELFRPFALTVTIALLASLAVALTIVPVLAYWFLRSKGHAHAAPLSRDEAEEREQRSLLQRGYLPILRRTQKHPVWTLVAGALVLIATVAMTPLMQTNLLGNTGQNSMSITQTLEPGSSLEYTLDEAKATEKLLGSIEGIEDVQLTIGNSTDLIGSSLAAGASTASFTVITNADSDQEALQNRVREKIKDSGAAGDVLVSASGGGFGMSSTIDVNVSAPSSDILRKASDQMLNQMEGLPGASEVSSNLAEGQPLVQIRVDRKKAVAAGLNEEQISSLTASTLSPIPAGTLRLEVTDYPVLVGKGVEPDSLEQLKALTLPTPAGPVPLTDVAEVEQVSVPLSITSANGERTARISITPAEDDLGSLSSAVAERVETLDLPPGATAEVGGAAEQQADSFGQLYLALLAAVAIVYVIMVATFKSLLQPLILLVSVPFAATGAIALLVITQVPLGLPSLIGMLMLVGIVVTNAIVLIDLINQYRQPHDGVGAMTVAEAVERGARQRLRPILMTALATVFALVPMALGLTGEGGFISQPLAIVVIGGLVSSTALTLVLVPVLYRLLEGRRERRQNAA
ncbi:efflux RND transporter permease subunit [Arthrobacter roseus]|uniref:efflux RND transporter permease subunit n=1 Tax=Arthrobacter roseus TaxID=136274 RepID=UPI0019636A6A|nr:efflux RND transporter permease subunit [Arthrobacter roseus]MBM7848951.1 HAE1 family hydrophobic/amphiphilic exporter-1 [Arthrobacter roseus]